MPTKDPARRRTTQRRLMSKRALFRRMWPRLRRYADDRGRVKIRATTNFKLWGSDFWAEEVCRVRWEFAAMLISGTLAEVVRDAPEATARGQPVLTAPSAGRDGAQTKALAAVLRQIDRQFNRELRARGKGAGDGV